jgi:hypothetical protein
MVESSSINWRMNCNIKQLSLTLKFAKCQSRLLELPVTNYSGHELP